MERIIFKEHTQIYREKQTVIDACLYLWSDLMGHTRGRRLAI